jgi:hypothetical protein
VADAVLTKILFKSIFINVFCSTYYAYIPVASFVAGAVDAGADILDTTSEAIT